MERHGHLNLALETRNELLSMSAVTLTGRFVRYAMWPAKAGAEQA
jgi:hypothetical protein